MNCFRFMEDCAQHPTFQTLMEIIEWHLKRAKSKCISVSTRQYVINLHYLKLYLMGTVLEHRNLLLIHFADEVILNLSNEDDSVQKFYLNIINYLNFNKQPYQQHSLYVSEDLEISEKEHRIVQTLDSQFRKLLLKYLHVSIRAAFITNMHSFFTSMECCLPAFLVLRYYPCILNELQPLDQHIVNYLLKFCDCDNEELISAIISCISTFLKNLDKDSLRFLKFGDVIHVLTESASPVAAVHRRLAVCDFLLDNKMLFCTRETCFTGS